MHCRCSRYSLAFTALLTSTIATGQESQAGSSIHDTFPDPKLAFVTSGRETPPDDDLASAIFEAYAQNPGLAAQRHELRAIDDEVGVALSLSRPTVQVQISSGYELILPGDITQASRSLSDRLNDPNIERNDIASQLVIDQPLWTGGRVSSSVRAARAASSRAKESLRAEEGDLLLDVIVAYSDVRRDGHILSIRKQNLAALSATLDEIVARRTAGELTRTDIAQGEVQLESARVQLTLAEAQYQSSRASFAAIVGREPGRLAPAPNLPNLPAELDDAFLQAEAFNPEFAAAIATERESRARIAVAKAEGAPQLNLQGTAGTSGPVSPFDTRDQDIAFAGRATLTIPLSAGGRVRSRIAQAQNLNAADQLRIEATRRQLVQAVVGVWNQWVSAEQSIRAQQAQLKAASIFYEGTTLEYREGLRSTFDVLFALNSVRDAEVALLASKRDSYVARATLLRQIGLLEARVLLPDAKLYDPDEYARKAQNRNALPWTGLIRTIDHIGKPQARPIELVQLPVTQAEVDVPQEAHEAPSAISSQVTGVIQPRLDEGGDVPDQGADIDG